MSVAQIDDEWSGVVAPDDFRLRPGDRLLEILERRNIDYRDFASAAEMAKVPEWATDENRYSAHRQACEVALRHYTHARKRKNPGREMVCRWARVLRIDPAYFFTDGTLGDLDLRSEE